MGVVFLCTFVKSNNKTVEIMEYRVHYKDRMDVVTLEGVTYYEGAVEEYCKDYAILEDLFLGSLLDDLDRGFDFTDNSPLFTERGLLIQLVSNE